MNESIFFRRRLIQCVFHRRCVDRPAAAERCSRLDVPVLRLLHRLRLLLHAQSLHRCHHRQFQHAEEKGWRRLHFIPYIIRLVFVFNHLCKGIIATGRVRSFL